MVTTVNDEALLAVVAERLEETELPKLVRFGAFPPDPGMPYEAPSCIVEYDGVDKGRRRTYAG